MKETKEFLSRSRRWLDKNAHDIETCFICGGSLTEGLAAPFRRCLNCGHEISSGSGMSSDFLVNDRMDEKSVRKAGLLDNFKARVLRAHTGDGRGGTLLDIGAGNGKFLLHNGLRYEKAIGLEVTPAAIDFSRTKLKLEIVTSIDEVSGPVTVATAWHSLEHIPPDQLDNMLNSLQKLCKMGARFIISVPNGESLHYSLFKNNWALLDAQYHYHNFTPRSLDLLLEKYDFQRVGTVYSTPYNIFSAIQSILNKFTGRHNYLYLRLKRGTRSNSAGSWRPILKNLISLPFAVFLGGFLSSIEFCLPHSNSSCLTFIYEKKY